MGLAVIGTDVGVEWKCDLTSELATSAPSRARGVRCGGDPGKDRVVPRPWNPQVCRWCAGESPPVSRPLPLDDEVGNAHPALKVLEHPGTGRATMSLFRAEPDQDLLAFLNDYILLGGRDPDLHLLDQMLRTKRGGMWQAIDPYLFKLPPPFYRAGSGGNEGEFRLARIPARILVGDGGADEDGASSRGQLQILSPAQGAVLPVGIPIVVSARLARGVNDGSNSRRELCGWTSVSGFQERVCNRASVADGVAHVVLRAPVGTLVGPFDRINVHVESNGARATVIVWIDNARRHRPPLSPLTKAPRARPSVLPFSLEFASPAAGAQVATSFTVAPTIAVEPEMAEIASSARALRRWLDV